MYALDFRPIACCNTLHQCLSKMLCAQLKVILHSLVTENQSAFVEGRLISCNVVITEDLIRLYKRGHVSPRCLFKIDLRKAFDTISWQNLF